MKAVRKNGRSDAAYTSLLDHDCDFAVEKETLLLVNEYETSI
ncbi:MAG: hypothetical protein VB049_06440 [Candidatus Pelethousia sp.]|nr:hypothetical protein [Candidatus Pelethousia sp.]